MQCLRGDKFGDRWQKNEQRFFKLRLWEPNEDKIKLEDAPQSTDSDKTLFGLGITHH